MITIVVVNPVGNVSEPFETVFAEAFLGDSRREEAPIKLGIAGLKEYRASSRRLLRGLLSFIFEFDPYVPDLIVQ
jgi:hypothetical protein